MDNLLLMQEKRVNNGKDKGGRCWRELFVCKRVMIIILGADYTDYADLFSVI